MAGKMAETHQLITGGQRAACTLEAAVNMSLYHFLLPHVIFLKRKIISTAAVIKIKILHNSPTVQVQECEAQSWMLLMVNWSNSETNI